MRAVRFVGGVLLIVSGLVWTLQGMNSPIAPQSFMTGSAAWIVIGAAAMCGGVFLVLRSRTRGH